MDIVIKYKHAAYRKFQFEPVWYDLASQRKDIVSYLDKKQDRESLKSRFYIADIDEVLTEKIALYPDKELVNKLVIQKANFKVSEATKANGYTTRLLFFVKDLNANNWFLYGYAKGLFHLSKVLNIREGQSLGYTFYISISDIEKDFSGSVSDNAAFKRRLQKLQLQ